MNSKCIKCDFQKERQTPNGVLYDFFVAFENGSEGSYSSKDKNNPKFKVGDVAEFEVEVVSGVSKAGNNYSFNKIKPVRSFNPGGFKEKPVKVWALDVARKYENSKGKVANVSADSIIKLATYIVGLVDKGIKRDAIETALTVASSYILTNEKEYEPKQLLSDINKYNDWL